MASQESANQAIKTIVEKDGRLDVVIHNAGHMVFGAAEAFTPEQLLQVYDTNVLSTQRVNRAALPQLRKQRKGLVLAVALRLIFHPTLRRKPQWMLLLSAMQQS